MMTTFLNLRHTTPLPLDLLAGTGNVQACRCVGRKQPP